MGKHREEGRDCTVFVLQQREEAARILRVFEVSVTEEQLARLLRMLTQELEQRFSERTARLITITITSQPHTSDVNQSD